VVLGWTLETRATAERIIDFKLVVRDAGARRSGTVPSIPVFL